MSPIFTDDGEKEKFVFSELIRALTVESATGRSMRSKFRLGQGIEARYRGKTKFYPGKISRENGDSTYDIDYDDGEKEFKVREDYIQSSASSIISPVRSSSVGRPSTPEPAVTRFRPSNVSTAGLGSAVPRRRAGTP